MPQDPARRWIVVADGGQARVLALNADRTGLENRREMQSADIHRKTHDLISDRPGRSFESASPTRHAIAPKSDAHEMAKDRFIAEVAQMLAQEGQAGAYDDLVLVVARGQVSKYRAALDKATRPRVHAVITKDLVKTPIAEIWDRMIEAGHLPPRPALPPLR